MIYGKIIRLKLPSMDINAILQQVADHHAPDLHLKVGRSPVIRMPNGDLFFSDQSASLSEEEMTVIAQQVAGPDKFKLFEMQKEVDFSYGASMGRFRVNLYKDKEGTAMAFRSIPAEVPTLESLGLPALFGELVMKSHGLVLVTGPTGSGKSTTLAAMLNHVNENRKGHILTIEDPIEFIHSSKNSLITQREVNSHTDSFARAIRSSLRQDPDVVLVGEMRDLETIAAAITLAETGHLVLSTLHTTDAAQTVDRVVDVFPSHQQQQIRAQLSLALVGVVSQTLVPRKDGQGRMAAFEIMLGNTAIRNCIKEGTTHQIYSMLQIGRSEGMQTLDDSLAALVAHDLVVESDALGKVHDADAFRRSVAQMKATLNS
jgi:twitching motility protein PilT